MKLHVETAGEGPDVVLLHGWGMHSGIWGEFAHQLAMRCRVPIVYLVDSAGARITEQVRMFPGRRLLICAGSATRTGRRARSPCPTRSRSRRPRSMSVSDLEALLRRTLVVPVLVIESVETAVPLAKLKLIEIPVGGLDCKACSLAAYEAIYKIEGVERVTVGDHVVLVLAPSCGRCTACRAGRPNFCELGGRNAAEGSLFDGTSRLSANGTRLNHFNSVSGFAERAVVPESTAIPVRQDVPLESLALVGCAVLTGYGAVIRTARVAPGSSVAVWGCGGVGLNIVQTARLAGAGTIVAVDVSEERLDAARRFASPLTEIA